MLIHLSQLTTSESLTVSEEEFLGKTTEVARGYVTDQLYTTQVNQTSKDSQQRTN